MKQIFIDRTNYMCHMTDVGDCIRIETTLFDGMSNEDIEQYRYVPYGYTWRDPDTGFTYSGDHMENLIGVSAKEAALNARIAELERIVEALTYTLNRVNERVTEVIKTEDSQMPAGDYINPIKYVAGMDVEQGKWYYDTDLQLPKEAIKDGVPASYDDAEYLV